MNKWSLWLMILVAFASYSCGSSADSKEDSQTAKEVKLEISGEAQTTAAEEPVVAEYRELSRLKLPEGFEIEVWADSVENARSMALSPSGTLFVGTRSKGHVYALKDTDGDNVPDKKYILATALRMPNGVAFNNGDLYVAEVSKLWRFKNIEDNLENPPKPQLIYDNYPTERHHGWKYIAFGPDGKLYVPVGAPCNVCEKDNPIYSTIMRMNADGSEKEVYAQGVRN